MSADLISGLLLAAVAIFTVGYIVKVLAGPWLAARLAANRAQPSPAANAHLIGAEGRVVDSHRDDGEMRVRVGMEGWRARLAGSDGGTLPVGTAVEVAGADGPVLDVVAKG